MIAYFQIGEQFFDIDDIGQLWDIPLLRTLKWFDLPEVRIIWSRQQLHDFGPEFEEEHYHRDDIFGFYLPAHNLIPDY